MDLFISLKFKLCEFYFTSRFISEKTAADFKIRLSLHLENPDLKKRSGWKVVLQY